jgi:predicted ArsR family transcriptional regulator
MIHANSIKSYNDVKPELSGRRKEIYLTICKRSKKMTDREVKDELQLPDMNSVRPRITELIKSGHLEEVGNVKCPLTGKTVRQVMVFNEAQMSLF